MNATLDDIIAVSHNQVTISMKMYTALCDAQRKLQCLENAGVDDWEWYDVAMEAFNNE